MVLYKCDLCNYSSNIKPHYIRHLNTKKHKNNQEIYEEEEKQKDTKGLKKTQKGLKNSNFSKKKDSKETQKDSKLGFFLEKKIKKNEIKSERFRCEYCDIELKTKPILLRHIRKYCKVKKQISNDENLKNELKQKNKELEEHKKEKEKLYNYIEKLIEKTGDTNINIENQTNTQNNQIILNNFGSEDISHITDKFMNKMLIIPYGGVQKLIEKVHFSNKKPENKNIALTNKKEKMIKIFKNNKWKYQNRDEILDELINLNYSRMDDYYIEKGKEKLNPRHDKIFLDFQEKFENQEEELHTKLKQDCEMILLSDNL